MATKTKKVANLAEEVSILSLRPALAELERYVQWVYRTRSGGRVDNTLPVTVSIQTRGGRRNLCGRFRPEGWGTREGGLAHDIMFSAEQLSRPVIDILETATHETCHLYNYDNGIDDCSKGGRHNLDFKETAEQFGLESNKAGGRGWSNTKLGPELTKLIEDDFRPDYTALNLFLNVRPTKAKGPPKRNNWRCSCTTVMLAARQVMEVECRKCGELLVKSTD